MPGDRPTIVKTPASLRDILLHADYIAERANLRVARRFVSATERTLAMLSTMPGAGSVWETENPRLSDLRFFPVSKFPNHLLFYRALPTSGILLVRVLHGAQDLNAILDE